MTVISSEGIDAASLDRSAVERLDGASLWLVQFGEPMLIAEGLDAVNTSLMRAFVLSLWAVPTVALPPRRVDFRIKARGIFYDIYSTFRVFEDDVAYDLWQIQITTQDWATLQRRACRFIVTRQSKDLEAEILLQQDTFVPSFVTAAGTKVTVPQNDLGLAHVWRAWRFPESFPDSDLVNWKIVAEGPGAYHAKPSGL